MNKFIVKLLCVVFAISVNFGSIAERLKDAKKLQQIGDLVIRSSARLSNQLGWKGAGLNLMRIKDVLGSLGRYVIYAVFLENGAELNCTVTYTSKKRKEKTAVITYREEFKCACDGFRVYNIVFE